MLKTLILLTFMPGMVSFSQDPSSQNIVHIPNIFTPNGDGINDLFRITATGFEEITVTIYNRQGEQVYRYFGVNGWWDGYTHAGVKVSPGTYFVIVEASNGPDDLQTDQEMLQVQY